MNQDVMSGVNLTSSRIEFSFDYDEDKIALCKRIGMRFRRAKRHWWLPRTKQDEMLFFRVFFPEQAAKFADLPAPNSDYVPNKVLMDHQKEGVLDIAANHVRWLYGWDTGTGKSLLGIELVRYWDVKTLVLTPLAIIEPAWLGDIRKFAPQIKAVNLWKHKGRQKKFFKQEIDRNQVCIINYESFRTHSKLLLECGFRMVIADESSKLKNPKSKITQIVTEFCKHMDFVYLLSATPAPNHLLEYFSQISILDASLFGRSYYICRNSYFYQSDYSGFKWSIKKDREKEYLDKIASVMSVVRKHDVIDLPERTDNIRDVFLSKEERSAYNDMAVKLVIEIEAGIEDGTIITASSAAIKAMKLRQVTSGFVFDKEGIAHPLGKSSKLIALLELLEELGDQQAIIWTQFRYEAQLLFQALSLKKASVKGEGFSSIEQTAKAMYISGDVPVAGVCNGLISQKLKNRFLEDFISGKSQYMIAHPASIGLGITLVNCSNAIYYSIDRSHERHCQSRDRIYRKGQVNKCSYYYLMVPKSIDTVVFKALQSKSKTEIEVLNYIKGFGKAKGLWEKL